MENIKFNFSRFLETVKNTEDTFTPLVLIFSVFLETNLNPLGKKLEY